MGAYILRRIVLGAFTVWLVTIFVFAVLRALPGDTALTYMAEQGLYNNARLQELRHSWHLDDPLAVQYGYWMRDIASGTFGHSAFSGEAVINDVGRAFPFTLELLVGVMALTALIGIPVGVLMATKRDTFVDYSVRVVLSLGLALPQFWIATLLLVFSATQFGWTPPPQRVILWAHPGLALEQLAFPTLILAIYPIALIARLTRSTLLDVLSADYVRTARAKGLPASSVLFTHALRNALLSIITVLGTTLTNLVGGAVVVETVFNLPGVGRLVVTAVTRRDYAAIEGATLIIAVSVVFVNLAVDLCYALADPRIRLA